MLRMEIALILILAFVAVMYFSAERKNGYGGKRLFDFGRDWDLRAPGPLCRDAGGQLFSRRIRDCQLRKRGRVSYFMRTAFN